MVHLPTSRLVRSRVLQNETVEGFPDDEAVNKNRVYVDTKCQLSNDPPEDGEIPDLKLCNHVEFLCADPDAASTYTEDRVALEIPYQFELYYNPEADFDRLRQFFEESSLEHMAVMTGTKDCHAFGTSNFDGRRRQLQEFTPEQLTRINGVGREPDDFVDERFADCVGQVDEEIAASTVCAPMLGGITLFLSKKGGNFTQEDETALKDAVRSVLTFGMEQDLYISPGNIEKVVFVEDREQMVSNIKEGIQVEGNGSGVSSKAIALMSGAAGLLVLILILLMAMFRRNRKETVTPRVVLDEAQSLDGSLADQDSLALVPQELGAIPEDGLPAEEYENSQPIMAMPPSRSLVVVGRTLGRGRSFEDSDLGQVSTFEGVYMTDDETARTGDEVVFNTHSMANYSDLEKSVIGEVDSTDQPYVTELSPRPVMKRYASEEYSIDNSASLASEDYETSSEYTPRSVLQMN